VSWACASRSAQRPAIFLNVVLREGNAIALLGIALGLLFTKVRRVVAQRVHR
jgi:hypothetical protein